MAIVVYGIPNCDTVKKARRWLQDNNVEYRFHDYKKAGIEVDHLARWASEVDWETLLNRRGTTWRKLDEATRDGVDKTHALALMAEHTSLIKRPVVETGEGLLVGFDTSQWTERLA